MNSLNHYAYGAIGEWLYRGVLGIDADAQAPGYRRILLHPRPDRKLGFARGTVETPYGTLAVDWRYEDGGLRLKVTVPANASAALALGEVSQAIEADGVAFERTEDGLCAELTSGAYEFMFAEK